MSADLIEEIAKNGVKHATARKRIQRAVDQGSIKRLIGITFPKKVSFLYHENTYGTPEYWDALIQAIDDSSPAYSAALNSLRARGGIVLEKYFPIISGSPIRQQKQVASDDVLERLKAVNVIQTINYDGIGPCITFHQNCHIRINRISLEEFRGQIIAEQILISAVREWARKLNIVSYNAIECRDEKEDHLPTVGTFNWDITAPSYLRPFLRNGRDSSLKAGFFVCDIAVDAIMDMRSIQAFIRKTELTSVLKKLNPVLFCIVAKGFTKEAFQAAKSAGIIVCTIENLFGKNIAEGLSSLIDTLSRMASMAAKRPEIVDEIFQKIGHIEGAAKNIRGSLFELLVGHCVLKEDHGSIDIGKIINDPALAKSYEIDIFRVLEHKQVWIYECKAYQPTVRIKKEEVERWYKDRVVPIARLLRQESRFRESKFYFEYWTCGGFEDEAEEYLKQLAERIKQYSIGYKDGEAVREYIKRVRPKSLLKSYDEHFYKHPLSKLERAFDKSMEGECSG
ncbi:hypothetical protein [Microbulbifer sp. VAAF005]|uniref:hypothetical protein n=1 Tax=Microbulbifer sp. VAAF005 TaxID=3034230 RepID=UPI0024AC98E3|nr:hypothetical protein [Microbulbifer sp. VAAF005]WHI44622.1 hypothetical protein P0078_12765 [Microbulbifer sp. VAAF005]